MVAGNFAYDFLHANLSFPGRNTTFDFINQEANPITEGVMKFNKLIEYLESKKLEKVWISDDMTGITGRVQYDSKTNQIVGLVLPLNRNSVPMTLSFPANSAKDIENYF